SQRLWEIAQFTHPLEPPPVENDAPSMRILLLKEPLVVLFMLMIRRVRGDFARDRHPGPVPVKMRVLAAPPPRGAVLHDGRRAGEGFRGERGHSGGPLRNPLGPGY